MVIIYIKVINTTSTVDCITDVTMIDFLGKTQIGLAALVYHAMTELQS